jgi:hypothetical protein
MTRTRFKNVMLVAAKGFPDQLIAGYEQITHVNSLKNIFPTINERRPDLIIFDYAFAGRELENTIRRLRINKFYNKTAIHCFKDEWCIKTDSLLKALGVDQFVYREDLLKDRRSGKVVETVNSVIDYSLAKLATSISN